MSSQSNIEWTDRTWNPIRGCSRVSAGCDNCYAMHFAHRFPKVPDHAFEGLTGIRNGKVAEPVKGATLIGDGPTALTKIKGIGNDLALDEGIGVCGKGGQSVPAGVGQPSLLIDGLTVGGTAA